MKDQTLSGGATQVRCVLLVVLTFCFGLVARGQGTSFISGYVLDASGAAVAGASVTVRSSATTAEVTLVTDTAGLYRTPALIPGTYRTYSQGEGFRGITSNRGDAFGGSAIGR